MSEKEKNPKDMSTSEIKEEIEVCYESLNTLMILSNQKMKLGSDIGGGIAKRIDVLKKEILFREEEEKVWRDGFTKGLDR